MAQKHAFVVCGKPYWNLALYLQDLASVVEVRKKRSGYKGPMPVSVTNREELPAGDRLLLR